MSRRVQTAAAFAAVYLVWGSGFLAIRISIETMPPFFMAGARFLIAGTILYVIARIRGSSKPTLLNWRTATAVGGLMLLCGHGGTVWAEQYIPSGLTSVLLGMVPLWLILIDSVFHRTKPNAKVGAGIILGFIGVLLLVNPAEMLGKSNVDTIVASALAFTTFLWALGSLYSRSPTLHESVLLSVAMEMLTGGALLLAVSIGAGEWRHLGLDRISQSSFIAWIYLVVFNALITFPCYIWLLKVSTTERVSTYAYVNPVSALTLGWAFASETLSPQNVLAVGIILTALIVISLYSSPKNNPKPSGQNCGHYVRVIDPAHLSRMSIVRARVFDIVHILKSSFAQNSMVPHLDPQYMGQEPTAAFDFQNLK